jgi:Cd(II)/Pb(II)-responsive transcriptional regulator
MQIGELARRFGVTVEAIRYYEREGLMPRARRTSANYRVYDEHHAEQLSFILNCRSLDMSQDEIRQLLTARGTPSHACSEVNELIDSHIVELGHRIRSLKQLLLELKSLRQSCNDARTVQQCEILSTLSRAARKRRTRA